MTIVTVERHFENTCLAAKRLELKILSMFRGNLIISLPIMKDFIITIEDHND